MRSLKWLSPFLFFSAALPYLSGAAPALEFPATCAANAHQEFILGVIALHSSSYLDAAEHFRTAERLDARCVIAYWGEAMTYNHPFWNQQDIAAARRVLLKLGPTRAIRLSSAVTDRERGYLTAVEILYGDGDRDARDFAFTDAMKKLSSDNPNDYEASAFYVLALLSSRRIGDPGYPEKQALAAVILERILKKYPDHPGALHYLMHTDDDPQHAHLALEAARKYENVAVGDSDFHAMHMPSHIYMQLGLWPDVVRANQTAFEASDRWVKLHHLNIAGRDYHSLQYLQYAYLQMGHYAKAGELMSLMFDSADRSGLPVMLPQAALIAAEYAVETQNWQVLTRVAANDRTPEIIFARGLTNLASGRLDQAKHGASVLDELVKLDVAEHRMARASTETVLEMLLLTRIALAEKRSSDAERLASEAAAIEAKMDMPPEVTGIVKPAAEFYGEILLEIHKPQEAAVEFAAALKQRPKRALSMLGLARAYAAAGDSNRARQAYTELATMWSDADPSLPSLGEVRRYRQ